MYKPIAPARKQTVENGFLRNDVHTGQVAEEKRMSVEAKTVMHRLPMSKINHVLTLPGNRSTLEQEHRTQAHIDVSKIDSRRLDTLARIYEMILGWEPGGTS